MKAFEVRPCLRQLVILSVALCLGGTFCGRAATREDFGYRAWTPPSPWKLLLVVVTYSDSQNPPDLNTLDQRVFGPSPSVVGFFQENSRGQMTFEKAGSVLLTLPTSERYANWEAAVGDASIARDLYFSNFVAKAFSAAGINLADYDTNHIDNKVTQGELDIVILSPGDENAFSQRRVSVLQTSSGRTWIGDALGMEHDSPLSLMAHELGHHCQTYVPGREYLDWSRSLDLYGRDAFGCEGANYLLTVMGLDEGTIHFDAYEKMRFGWLEPRIYSMTEHQTVSISAAQLNSPDGPVVIYDPNRGPGEYFVLEYRTPTCSNDSVYDKNVPGSGLVIWHVQLDANKNHLWLADALLPTNSQKNWWWCMNCSGLFYSTNGVGGVCGAGGAHQRFSGWQDIRIPFSSAWVAGETNWNYCSKCSMLFYGPNEADSHCPKSGTHSNSGSGNYTALTNGFPFYPYWNPALPWHRCSKCQSMFNTMGQNRSVCPGSVDGLHDGTDSPSYDFEWRMQRVSIGALGAPDLLYNSSAQWTSGSRTPPLRWFDGTPTSTQIYVHPFQPGADSIVVEWGTLLEAWVDFAYVGAPVLPEWGTFALPFNTLPEAVDAVLSSGTVRVKAGHTPAPVFISKPLRLESYGGTAIIGQ